MRNICLLANIACPFARFHPAFAVVALGTAFSQAGECLAETGSPASASAEPAATMFPIPDYTGRLWERAALTGDWGGARTSLAENNGLQLEANVYNYYQGIVGGGQNDDWESSGIAEYIVKFDSGQSGLWPGGFLFARGETYFGRDVNASTGALMAVNTHFASNQPAGVGTYLPHLYYSHVLNEKVAVLAGKLDATQGDLNAFAQGLGRKQFMNLGFNVNPVLLQTAPYSPLGAGIQFTLSDKLVFKFLALDTEGQIDRAGFDTVFKGGTTYLAELASQTNFFDLPGSHKFAGLYSTQKGNAVQQDPRIFLPGGGGVVPNQYSESWALTYNFDQYLVANPGHPGEGWGIFGRAGVSDGKANLIEQFYSAGLGGTGIIPGREDDRFGIGYYYLGLAGGRRNIVLGRDEHGVEVFYNLVPAPWCDFTVNLQVIDPAGNDESTTTVLGLRGTMRF